MTIDRDRDYLLSVIIDLNTTLTEYKNAYDNAQGKIVRLIEEKTSLVEANGQALANAEGWKQRFDGLADHSYDGWCRYRDLLRAARKDAGWSRTKSYLRHLGLPED